MNSQGARCVNVRLEVVDIIPMRAMSIDHSAWPTLGIGAEATGPRVLRQGGVGVGTSRKI